MTKKSLFVCQQCGYESTGWLGKCPNCSAWGSLVETVDVSRHSKGSRSKTSRPSVSLASIKSKDTKRISTEISELDRVLGGGIVPGQVILVAGEPGIGKSTILLQLSEKMANRSGNASATQGSVLYASGEESAYQIKIRADRLGLINEHISILESSDVDEIVSSVEDANDISLLIIDSIQTMQTTDLTGMSGSVGQVRECAYRLVRLAKSKNIPVIIVGHVTKEGNVAGPAVLAHIVDTVLWFEGDKNLTIRLLRAVKNRFGPTDEVGIFSMEDRGLISVDNPEKLFISENSTVSPGSSVASVMRGTRPVLVEIQALVVPTKTAFPRRIAQGIDAKRFEILLAVLIKRAGIPLYDFDCYLNVSGGISIKEPSSDLAVCMALASAYFDKPLPRGHVAIGEVGLLGDIREVAGQDRREKEAKRLGYKHIIGMSVDRNISSLIKKFVKGK